MTRKRLHPKDDAKVKVNYRLRWNKVWETYKETTPCFDCGNSYRHRQMEFDHVRGTKDFNISSIKHGSMNTPKAQAELEKCDLVCALCHRTRTYYREMFRRQSETS